MRNKKSIAESLVISTKSNIGRDFFTLEFTGEEITWGNPAVVIWHGAADWLELPLCEVPCLKEMLMGILEEIKPFTDGQWFEIHKQGILRSSRMAWVDTFENYHLFMDAYHKKTNATSKAKNAPKTSDKRIQFAKIELNTGGANGYSGLSVCFEGEEAQWGVPLIGIGRNAVGWIDCPLQDVHILIDMCEKILAETAVFREKEYFYKNISELSRSPRASWVDHFDNYHRLMDGKNKSSQQETTTEE